VKKISLLFVLISFIVLSCGETTKTPIPLPKPGVQSQSSIGSIATNIILELDPATLTFGGTASIRATVTDKDGANVSDGTIVSFAVTDAALGTITPLTTTSNGIATVLFTAGKNVPGPTTITAQSGPARSDPGVMTVVAPLNGSIEFLSASPQVIGIKGSGQGETSHVAFTVKDVQGNPVINGVKIDFTLSGPGGGAYIGTSTGSTSAEGSTNGGVATVILNSGSVAGPVTIRASVKNTPLSSSSPTISIGGGVASGSHFNLAASRLNLPGLIYSGRQSTISAFIADRFGNFNVLKGTSVSFYTEAGAIDRSSVTDGNGGASVVLRTQLPDPVVVASAPNPVNGHVSILATVMGEEGFDDVNGNGLYDSGDGFDPLLHDLPEPFIDVNSDGSRSDGTINALTLPFEMYIDANGNGRYDGKNNIWDGPGCPDAGCQKSKMIYDHIDLAFTGGPTFANCVLAPITFVASGGFVGFTFTLGDKNLNALVPGTTITFKNEGGKLLGQTTFTLLDQVGGPTVIGFALLDDNTASSTPASVTAEVKGADGVSDCSSIAIGSI